MKTVKILSIQSPPLDTFWFLDTTVTVTHTSILLSELTGSVSQHFPHSGGAET